MTLQMTRRALLSRSTLIAGGAVAGALRPDIARAVAARAAGPIRLIANENPYGPSPAAQAAAKNAVAESWKYAFRQEGELRRMIARRENLSPKHVMIAAGSGEILRIAALVYGQRGGEVLAARPTFSFLTSYARELGCRIVEVPLDETMTHDLEGMARRVGNRTRLIYICNPNNPTGTRLTGAVLRPFLAGVSGRVPVLVDEAYLDLASDMDEHTAVERVRAGDGVIVTRTFSKLHGMAGLRIGYALARPDIISDFERLRMSLLNLPGLRAATASYADLEYQAFSRARINEGRAICNDLFDELGRAHSRSAGNFVYFDTGGPAPAFARAMRDRGIMVGRAYPPYKTWCRVSIGTVEDMRVFAEAARDWFRSA